MSAALLDDLLAEFIKPTPAKAANSANREDWRGLPADSVTCEALRIVAKPQPDPEPADSDSQVFAEIRNPANTPESEQRRAFSQDSQDSQGWADPKTKQTCAACANRLRHGTCGDPVAAGLLSEADGFGIVWPPDNFGADCLAWKSRQRTAGDADEALPVDADEGRHAGQWDDKDMASFLDRRARLMRWGWVEADAECWAARLVVRDRDADTRVSCADCAAYRPGQCGNHQRAGLLSPEVGRDWVARLERCPGFQTVR